MNTTKIKNTIEAIAAHTIAVENIFSTFKTTKAGLSQEEVLKRQVEHGFNELPEQKRVNPVFIFLKQFKSTLLYILFVAAALSAWFGHMVDMYVIIGVVVLNAIIGFLQEYRAEKAIDSLKRIIVAHAKVYRDDELVQIPARELVLGDVILLEEGDRVPADARLIELRALRTVESSLTGESMPVEKRLGMLPAHTTLADRTNMVWMSTFVAGGTAKAVIIATGKDTAIGDIAETIESIDKRSGHFEEKTNHLVRQMATIAIIGSVVTFVVGYFVRNLEFVEIFLFSVANMVSAIPEGLPAVLTIVLAVGAHRMSRRNAIIRSLPATEALGVTNVIITDKTGTLTENVMKVEKIVLPSGASFEVGGSGWSPTGSFVTDEREILPAENSDLDTLLRIGLLSNNARIVREEGKASVVGDPTEAAFIVLAEKAGLKRAIIDESEKRVDDQPFSSDLKYRATLVETVGKDIKKYVYAVGAPEAIFRRTTHMLVGGKQKPLDQQSLDILTKNTKLMAAQSMRVIALAFREAKNDAVEVTDESVIGLVLVGLVGMIDPPRAEVKDALEKAKLAGIRVIMATGDHADTARAIAQKIGLVSPHVSIEGIAAHTGQELEVMNDAEFETAVKNVSVFARLTPSMKMKIASTLQKNGLVVAMTGDGVNDAPALKRADIGISMGITGTDVARDSSHMVLADDNFASIISAVEEGRVVFTNTRNCAYYLLTTNFAATTTLLVALFIGYPLPLLPIHILWINLVTDGFSTIGLALESGNADIMSQPPINKREAILGKNVIPFLILMTIIMVVATIAIFTHYLPHGLEKARGAAFIIVCLTQLFNLGNMRSLNRSLFSLGVFSNLYAVVSVGVAVLFTFMVIYVPFFRKLFQFASFSWVEMGVMILISSSVLWAGEAYKFFKKHK